MNMVYHLRFKAADMWSTKRHNLALPFGLRPGRMLEDDMKPGALWELRLSGVEQVAPGSRPRNRTSSSYPFMLSLLPPTER